MKKHCVLCVEYREVVTPPTIFPAYIDWCYSCVDKALVRQREIKERMALRANVPPVALKDMKWWKSGRNSTDV